MRHALGSDGTGGRQVLEAAAEAVVPNPEIEIGVLLQILGIRRVEFRVTLRRHDALFLEILTGVLAARRNERESCQKAAKTLTSHMTDHGARPPAAGRNFLGKWRGGMGPFYHGNQDGR